jgi:ABC-type dipeptide/oligopeptide/nickel transport system permease component
MALSTRSMDDTSNMRERIVALLVYVITRLLWAIPTFWLAITIAFIGLNQAYTQDVRLELDQAAEGDEVAPVGEVYAFEGPLQEQYVRFLGSAVRFDWGESVTYAGWSVRRVILTHLPVTAVIGALASLLAVGLGIPLGIRAARLRGSWRDRAIVAAATLSYTFPTMVLAVLLLMLVAIRIPWLPMLWGLFPVLWDGSWRSYVLPSLVLGLGAGGYLARVTRASVLEVLGEDYVRTARAKGFRDRTVHRAHVLRNALPPIVAALGPTLAALLTGSLLVEYAFGVPGTGKLLFESFAQRDYPLILVGVTLYTLIVVLANLAADVAYALSDPRIKLRSW